MSPKDFLGLSKRAAQNLAEARNLVFRLIRVDKESFFEYPSDFARDRICIEIDAGQVTKSVIG